MWVCPGEQAREEPGEPEFREQRLALLLGCLRREKNCCDLSRFENHPGSPPAPGRAQHCTLPPTQSRRDLPFLPLEGVLPTANKAGPHEHTVNVSSTREEILSAGK